MAKAKVGSANMPVPAKIQYGRQVVTNMTGNANFTTPAPSLASITAAATALETAYNAVQAAYQTAKGLTVIQNQKAAVLDLLLAQEANYVQNTSGGDAAKIDSSGFGVKNPPTPIGVLPAPVVASLVVGQNAGTMTMKWGKVRGARSYIVERATDPLVDSSWVQAATPTKASATFNSMTSGTRYWIRVGAVGAAGLGDWSPAISLIAP